MALSEAFEIVLWIVSYTTSIYKNYTPENPLKRITSSVTYWVAPGSNCARRRKRSTGNKC
jgi:hypothetical protein